MTVHKQDKLRKLQDKYICAASCQTQRSQQYLGRRTAQQRPLKTLRATSTIA